MSAINNISGYGAGLLSLLSQADSGSTAPSLVDSLLASGVQNVGQSSTTPSPAAGNSSNLLGQVQSAITSALQSAEQSGATDLKGVIYNTLVRVLDANGIDPKTFQPTSDSGQPTQAENSNTSSVLSAVLSAISGATAASDPLTQLLSSENQSQQSSNPLSTLAAYAGAGSTSTDLASQLLSSQNNNQNLLGFLFDSGQ